MIGNRVRLITNDGSPASGAVTGILHKLDEAGAIIWREADHSATVFIPMLRIREIIDLGRAP